MCSPAVLMRKVCRPGKVGWPRIFMISSLRTMELPCALWRNQIKPSATVNTGFASVSEKYSPIRKVVACQLVSITPRSWMNFCRPANDVDPFWLASTMARNESMNTRPGPRASTSAAILAITLPRSPVALSSDRLMNRIARLTLSRSKKSNCCW